MTQSVVVPMRQLLILLATFIPLLFALRWVASKFPVSSFEYSTEVRYVEPGRVALYCEHHRNAHTRIFVLDFDKETLNELPCPRETGIKWDRLYGVDVNGNAICLCRCNSGYSDYDFYTCDLTTGQSRLIGRWPYYSVLIGNRFLFNKFASDQWAFFWHDLRTDLGHHEHMSVVGLMYDYPVAIPESDSFYFISQEVPVLDESAVSVEPDETLVLMNMSANGPSEIARWPVTGGGEHRTYRVGDGCIGCQSMDRKFVDIHDAKTGVIRFQIPIPPVALDANANLNSLNMFGSFVILPVGFGATQVTNTESGVTFDTSSSWNGIVFGRHGEEYLTLRLKTNLDDWPGELQILTGRNGDVIHNWAIPDSYVLIGTPPTSHTVFSPDGREIIFITLDGRVIFVDKANGNVVRTIQPRFWIPYISVLVGLATLAWMVCWIRLSIRIGAPLWLDAFLILSTAFVFLWWRITLSGSNVDHERPAWQGIAGLLIAAATVTVHQTLYSGRGFTHRILPTFAFFTCLFVAIRFLFDEKWYVNAVTTRAFILGCVLVLGSIVTHRFCPSIDRVAVMYRKGNSYRLTLRQLLFITAFCALVMAALRLIDLQWSFDILKRDGIAMSILAAISLVIYCLTICPGLVLLKTFSVAVLLADLLVVLIYRQGWWYSTDFDFADKWSESIALISIATILVTLPIAMRQRLSLNLPNSKHEEMQCVQ